MTQTNMLALFLISVRDSHQVDRFEQRRHCGVENYHHGECLITRSSV